MPITPWLSFADIFFVETGPRYVRNAAIAATAAATNER